MPSICSEDRLAQFGLHVALPWDGSICGNTLGGEFLAACVRFQSRWQMTGDGIEHRSHPFQEGPCEAQQVGRSENMGASSFLREPLKTAAVFLHWLSSNTPSLQHAGTLEKYEPPCDIPSTPGRSNFHSDLGSSLFSWHSALRST